MTGFSICKRYTALIWQNMPCHSSEYILSSKYARTVNMAEFGKWKSYTGF